MGVAPFGLVWFGLIFIEPFRRALLFKCVVQVLDALTALRGCCAGGGLVVWILVWRFVIVFGPVRSVVLEVRVCALACFVSSSYGVLYDLCPVASGLDLVVGTCRFWR